MNYSDPDYVVVGKTNSYNYEKLERACAHIQNGAKLFGTNPDVSGPAENGIVPATGALISPLETASSAKAYFVGKPNPLIMRNALKKLECRREKTVIVGDRMDTDIIAGVEAEIETVLVLSGVTAKKNLINFAYQPDWVMNGIFDLTPHKTTQEVSA